MSNVFDGVKKLGFGMMRLPKLDENDESKIDLEETCKMVDYFIEHGYNYFDTAIMYMGMMSQKAVGECVSKRYDRDKFKVATKMHRGFFKDENEREEIFNRQLSDMAVDFIDYYLIHDLSAKGYEIYNKTKSFEWLKKKQEAGKVRHIGFSHHDDAQSLEMILTQHPEIEFVQLQLNYLDWDDSSVQSRACYEVCTKFNKPVVVMEGLRGGVLTNVSDKVKELFDAAEAFSTPASWAFRFVESLDNVKLILSGMSNFEQMQQNVDLFDNIKPLNDEQMQVIEKAKKIIAQGQVINCTGCKYCVEGCPVHIDIPRFFALLNTNEVEKNNKGFNKEKMYYDRILQTGSAPDECIACGACESICPQHLAIIDGLKQVYEVFKDMPAMRE